MKRIREILAAVKLASALLFERRVMGLKSRKTCVRPMHDLSAKGNEEGFGRTSPSSGRDENCTSRISLESKTTGV
jgi:hypothetical protein